MRASSREDVGWTWTLCLTAGTSFRVSIVELNAINTDF